MSSNEEKMDVLIALGEAWKSDPDNYIGDILYQVMHEQQKEWNVYYIRDSEFIQASNNFRDRVHVAT